MANEVTVSNDNKALGRRIKRLRLLAGLTLCQLSVESSVSASHLGSIERGEHLPSARILRRIAKPLGFNQSEILRFVNYLLAEDLVMHESSSEGRQCCELLATCPFFNDRAQNTFEMAETYKEQYCRGIYPWCGRYMVFKALERENLLSLFRKQQ